MEGVFGKHYEIMGHMIEVEFLTLDPKSLKNLQKSSIFLFKIQGFIVATQSLRG
jgi:hypothetical protein